MKNILFPTLLISALVLSSCKKDEEKPQINVDAPADHAEFAPGDEVHSEFEFTDNEALASYSVHIANEDGSHNEDFNFEKEGNISGTSYTFHQHFDIPTTITPDHYMIVIQVLDMEGNMAEESVEFHVEE